jgi:putative DNA methylase
MRVMKTPPIPLDSEFPVDFANQIARLETYNKHYYRPNTYLHKWWARRCGSTFRLILKQLVTDEAQRDYYAPGGLEGKRILDPMMGGGTTLHEAIRLGANVMGADLDPIPVLQARASLSTLKLVDLEQAYQRFFQALHVELAPYFTTSCPACDGSTGKSTETAVRFTLYGLRRRCACGPALFVDSLVLRQESDGSTIRMCPACQAVLNSVELCSCGGQSDKLPLREKRARACPDCGQDYAEELGTPFYARYEPLVVVGRCQEHGLFFKNLSETDYSVWNEAEVQRPFLFPNRADFAIRQGRKSRHLILRGIDNYLDLFSSRQLIYLKKTIQLLPQFEPLIRLNLGLLVSTSLEYNAMLSGYKGKNKRRAGAIRHTFSHHAYSFPYTAVENNPVYPRKSSGTLQRLFEANVRNGRLWAAAPRERDLAHEKPVFVEIEGEVDAGIEVCDLAEMTGQQRRFWLRQGTSTRLDLPDDSVDAIVTDPPYFDSVQYSDLAAFFRVWLRHLLTDAADWDYDIRQSAVDPHKNDRQSRYTEIISGIFAECHRVLKKGNGRFVFTFHHWNPKGWAALTIALKQAGFVLVNRYVVLSESPISVHVSNMKALRHDAILVFAPVEAEVEKGWERPSTIRPMAANTDDSCQFTHDCATLLGWLLASDLPDDAISRLWRQVLG